MRYRILAGAIVVLAVEAYLWWRYALLGAQLHFWLHLMHGMAFGLGTWTVARLVVNRSLDAAVHRGAAASAAFGGHLFAAMPDLLFIAGGVVHMRWMDVFAVHIRGHMIPGALWVSVGMVGLAAAGWVAMTADRSRSAWAFISALVLTVAISLMIAPPIPDTLEEVRELADGGLWCPLLLPDQQ